MLKIYDLPFRKFVLIACCLALTACVSTDRNVRAIEIGDPQSVNPFRTKELNLRAMQSRRFFAGDQKQLLNAATATLQDLGFAVRISLLEHGLIVGEKDRDAVEAQWVTGSVIFALLGGGFRYNERQIINVSLIANESANKSSVVRVLFDRRVHNNLGQLTITEIITQPKIYIDFFKMLGAALQLEAHEI
jgi:hypothetical protein